MMLEVVNGLCPSYLSEMFTFNDDYSLQSSRTNLALPKKKKTRTNYYKNNFFRSQDLECSSFLSEGRDFLGAF